MRGRRQRCALMRVEAGAREGTRGRRGDDGGAWRAVVVVAVLVVVVLCVTARAEAAMWKKQSEGKSGLTRLKPQPQQGKQGKQGGGGHGLDVIYSKPVVVPTPTPMLMAPSPPSESPQPAATTATAAEPPPQLAWVEEESMPTGRKGALNNPSMEDFRVPGCRKAPVALCLVGQTRTALMPRADTVGLHACTRTDDLPLVQALHRNVIEPWGGTEQVNVFADLATSDRILFDSLPAGSKSFPEAIWSAYRPRRFVMGEHPVEFHGQLCGNTHYIQFARWNGCADMIEEYEEECGFEHQTIIQTRPDVFVPPMCRIPLEPDSVYGRPHNSAFSDTFSFGKHDPMLKRLRAIESLSCRRSSAPVKLLASHLKAQTVHPVPMPFYKQTYVVRVRKPDTPSGIKQIATLAEHCQKFKDSHDDMATNCSDTRDYWELHRKDGSARRHRQLTSRPTRKTTRVPVKRTKQLPPTRDHAPPHVDSSDEQKRWSGNPIRGDHHRLGTSQPPAAVDESTTKEYRAPGGCRKAPIALCLTGQLRTMLTNRENTTGTHECARTDSLNLVEAFRANVMEPLGGVDKFNVYADISNVDDVVNRALPTNLSAVAAFRDAWQPRRFLVGNHAESFHSTLCGNAHYIQFARWRSCARMIEEDEMECGFEYEHIVQTRPDVWVPPMCPFETEPGTVYGRPHNHAFSDTFSYGQRWPMLERLRAIDSLHCAVPEVPVRILAAHLQSKGVHATATLYFMQTYIARVRQETAGGLQRVSVFGKSCTHIEELVHQFQSHCNDTRSFYDLVGVDHASVPAFALHP